MKKSPQNLWAKVATVSWWLSLAKSPERSLFYLFFFFLPIQLGKHFWPSWSFVYGQRVDYLSPTIYVTDILAVLLFVWLLIKKEIRISPFFLFVILSLSITIFFSKSPMAGWYYLLKFWEMGFVAYATIRLSPSLSRLVLGTLLSFSIIGESIIALIQALLQKSAGGLFYFLGERTFSSQTPGIANASIHGVLVLRPYATFPHPNVLAGFLLCGILLVWHFLYNQKSVWTKYVLGLTTIVGTGGLLLSLSRTTILIGVIICIIVLFRKLRRIYLPLFVCSLITVFLLFPALFYRFAPATFEEPAGVRIQLMKTSLSLILAHPLLGVGLGNFLSSAPSADTLQPVHNIFLLWLSETGLIGGVIAGIFLLACLKKVYTIWHEFASRRQYYVSPITYAILSIFTLGMFDHYFLTLQQGQLLFAFVVGFLFARQKK